MSEKKIDVKAIREEIGLTQESFASKLGVSWPTVQRWESGKNKPSKTNLARIKKIEEEIKYKKKVARKFDGKKCPSCFGIVRNNKCQDCGAVKVGNKFVPPEEVEEREVKMEEKEGDIKVEEKEEKENGVKYIWSPGILHSYICECGTEVNVEENTQTSFWSGIEWVVCPNCDERRRKENLLKAARRQGK